MRRPAPSLAIHLVLGSFCLVGCTPEPIGRGLWTARAPDAPATSGNWQKNRDAIALAQRGDYDRALAALPTADDVKDDPSVVQDESRTLEVRTLVEENRETLAYWRLRKAFAGAGVAPDTWVAARSHVVRETSDTTRRTVLTNALDVEAAGIGVVVPVHTAFEDGANETRYGDTILRFTYYAGKASTWTNTKVAFGMRSALPTGPKRYRDETLLVPFARVGYAFAPFAIVAGVSSQLFAGEGDATGLEQATSLRLHLLAHPRFTPFIGAAGVMRFGASRTGDAAAGGAAGVRIFLDGLDQWQLELLGHAGASESTVTTRSTGASAWLSWRW